MFKLGVIIKQIRKDIVCIAADMGFGIVVDPETNKISIG